MKMKYSLKGFELNFGTETGKFDGGLKVEALEIEQEFDAKDLIEVGIPALKEVASLLINTQKELTAQHNSNIRKEFEIQERKFNEELRRNRRMFNKRESQ